MSDICMQQYTVNTCAGTMQRDNGGYKSETKSVRSIVLPGPLPHSTPPCPELVVWVLGLPRKGLAGVHLFQETWNLRTR